MTFLFPEFCVDLILQLVRLWSVDPPVPFFVFIYFLFFPPLSYFISLAFLNFTPFPFLSLHSTFPYTHFLLLLPLFFFSPCHIF